MNRWMNGARATKKKLIQRERAEVGVLANSAAEAS